jgi:hypothetical protein
VSQRIGLRRFLFCDARHDLVSFSTGLFLLAATVTARTA